METIAPLPLTRLKIADAPPEAAPENPPERFAQVMARQKKFSRSKEKPAGLDREEPLPKTSLTPEEKSKPESLDSTNDPEITSFLTIQISNVAIPAPPDRTWEPTGGPEDKAFSPKLESQTPNPTLASTEQIASGSSVQLGPGEILIKSTDPGVKPQDSLPPGTPGEASRSVLLPGLIAQLREDPQITNETDPALATVQPGETMKNNPTASKAFEDLILYPSPESLTIKQQASPEITEIVLRSSQTTAENGPSFSPQGPAIPETTPIIDGLDPSPSLILRNFALQGQDSETPNDLEVKPESPASPLEALSKTEKVVTSPILEGPPTIAKASPVESNSKIVTVSEKAEFSATSNETLLGRGISSLERAEGLPDPEKTSRTIAGLDPKTSLIRGASAEKVEPGPPLQYPGENRSGSSGTEINNPIRFQEDTPLGVIAKFPDQPRVEGVPADRLVEGPKPGSPEWIKEALSVYQQYSKGLLRTLQQSGERIQMSLDPPQLGNILMEINRDRNSVTAHLWTDNPHTKELLDFSQGQLQKTLQLDGFKLDRFEVLVQPDLKSFQEERWFGGRQPAWESSRQEGSRTSPEGLIPASPETAALRFSQGNRYVDTWV